MLLEKTRQYLLGLSNQFILIVVSLGIICMPVPASAQSRAEKLELRLRSWMSERSPFTTGIRKRSGFFAFRLDDPQPFELPLGTNPERICDRLDEQGFGNLGWRRAEVIESGWECVIIANALSGDPKTNSLFYQLRGATRQRLTSARLKINVPQSDKRQTTLTSAAEFVRVFGKSVPLEIPDGVLEAVRTLAVGRFLTETATFTLRSEFGDANRYNLAIEFGRPQNAFLSSPETRSVRIDEDRTVSTVTDKADRLGQPR